MRTVFVAAVLFGFISSLPAGEKAAPPPAVTIGGIAFKRKVDRQAAEMDYGPFLACNLGITPANIAFKGIVIPLNAGRSANICFDTELLRVAGAWSGGWIDLAGRPFADNSNDYPLLGGALHFSTEVTPGWGIGGEREDPRGAKDAIKDGSLPKAWARWRGLYLHGKRVVLSYSVDTADVLESFGLAGEGEAAAFTRNINLSGHDKPLSLLACEVPVAAVASGKLEAEQTAGGPLLKLGQHTLCIGGGGLPADAKWEVAERRVYLNLPPAKLAVKFVVSVRKVPSDQAANLKELPLAAEDLSAFVKGGPPRWAETVATKGEVSAAPGPYVIDTIAAPSGNPYKSWLRFTALDFFRDGRAALCTWNGDVWIASGIDAELKNVVWRRFAAGLAGPMGLKIVDDVIYVAARDQITRLRDLNGDGEADFYENFNNDCFLTTNFHEYCFDLQTDSAGNFYFAKGSAIWAGSQRMTAHAGSVCKVSRDGSTFETLCSGLRAPNGLAIGLANEIICGDNQGNWVPLCPLNLIRKGAYYGFVGKDQKSQEREPPICWIPHAMDKSTSGLLWVDSDKWGPLKGQLIALSYGCGMAKVCLEKTGDSMQGGVVMFPLKFGSGIMRGRFNPRDGQLYVCGLRGWSSNASRECEFSRVRYTGAPVLMPLEVKTRAGGLDIVFSGALDPASAAPENVGAECYNVKRTSAYGSPEFTPSDPNKKGKEPLEIKEVRLSADGRTLSLRIPALKPVHVLSLKFRLKSADGAAVNQELAYTINRVGE